MTAEASYPAYPNDTARLQSIQVPGYPHINCLTFYHHMFGRHIETLNVYTQNSSGFESLVWTKKGNQGDKWRKSSLNLNSYNGYTIIFEAVRGVDYEVYILTINDKRKNKF